MVTRKTFEVADLLEKTNWFLKNSPDYSVCERNAYISIMGNILHDTGNYAGFTYLGEFGKDTDNSRICFFIKYSLVSRYKVYEDERVSGGVR